MALLLSSITMAAWAGSLEVYVYEQDSGGKPQAVPGATIQLSDPRNPPRLREQAKATGLDGKALFAELPDGPGFVLQVSAAGYQPFTDRAVQLPGGLKRLRIQLLPLLTTTVDLIEQGPVVQLGQTESTTAISGEYFNDLPVYGRDYQSALVLAPGVNDTDRDGNVTVHGSRERDFKVTVDGVSNVDPVTGQRLSAVNPDAIEEIQVVDSGADLTQGGAVGGYARITTKSGANEFEGSASIYLVDDAIDNDGAGDTDPLPRRRRKPAAFVSGPIFRDRLWYVAALELLDESRPINVIGGQDAVIESSGRSELAKLTWQLNAKNRLAVQYSADPLTIEPYQASTLRAADSSSDYERGGPTYSLKWTSTLSPRSYWESTVALSDIKYEFRPHAFGVRNLCATGEVGGISVDRLFCFDRRSGIESGTNPQTYADRRERRSYALDATTFLNEWLGGSHDIRYGLLLERTNWQRHQSDDPTLQRQPFSLQVVALDPNNPGSIDPRNLPANRIFLTRSFPDQLQSEARGNNFALYLVDGYQPWSNLSIEVGLRYNREELSADGFESFDPARERATFATAYEDCVANPFNSANACVAIAAGRFTGSPYDNPNAYPACSVAPNPAQCTMLELARDAGVRIHFRTPRPFTVINSNLSRSLRIGWDPRSDGKTQLSGGYTRLYGDAFFQLFLEEQGPDTLQSAFSLNSEDQAVFDLSNLGTAFQISTVDRNLNSPYADEITLGLQREIAPETSLTVRWIQRGYRDLYQDTDVNHDPVIFDDLTPRQLARFGGRCRRIGKFADCTGEAVIRIEPRPGGRQSISVIDVPDGIADLQVVSPLFNSIYEISNLNRSDYDAYVIGLTRRFWQNWEASGTYTWSRSIGQAEDFADTLGNDRSNVDDERGPLGTDQRHVVKLSGRKLVSTWGGMRFGGNVVYQTGLPYSIVSNRQVLDFPTDLSGGRGIGTIQYSTPRVTFPTGTRNDQRNPSHWRVDVNLQKELKLRDTTLVLQASVFNLLNAQTLEIERVERLTEYNARLRRVWLDLPVSARDTGRYLELAAKVTF